MQWLFVCVLAPFAVADPPDLNLMAHRQWTHRSGLTNHSLSAISQDAQGFIWFAAQEGAIRFDGRFMVTREGTDEHPFPRDDMRTVTRDAEGALWWGMHSQGVWRFKDGVLQRPFQQNALDGRSPITLHRDTQGMMWVGTEGNGLLRQVGSRLEPVPSVPLRVVKTIAERDGVIWVGGEGALYRGGPDGFEAATLPGFSPSDVHALLAEGDQIWVADQLLGLWRIRGDQAESVFFNAEKPNRNRVMSLARDAQGVLWFGTSGGLGLHIDGQTRFFETVQGNKLGRINALFCDRDGFMWASDVGTGVHRFNPGLFQTYLPGVGLQDALTWTVFEHEGVLWTGRDGGFLSWFNLADGAVLPLPKALRNLRAFSLAHDPQGRVIIGSLDAVFRWDGNNLEQIRLRTASGEEPGLGVVTPMFADRDGRIWFGQADGLGCLDGETYTIYQDHGMASATLQGIDEGPSGELWLATEKGLMLWRSGALEHVNLDLMGMDAVDVLAIGFDAGGRLIFSVTGSGLWVLDGNEPRPVGIPELQGQSLFGVICDSMGNLWVPSNIGVFMVTPALLDASLKDTVGPNQVFLFGKADGMIRAECNLGGSPANLVLSDGRFAFSTTAGVALVDPEQRAAYTERWTAPSLFLEQLTVDGRRIPLEPNPHLPYDFQQVALQFSAIEHRAPEALKVYARLSGFDRDWDQVNALTRLDYTRVPPGEYQFEIRAFGRGDLMANLSLPVTVAAPWFAEMRLTLGLVFFGLLLGGLLLWRQQQGFQRVVVPTAAKHDKVYMAVEESRARLARAQHQIEEVGGQASQNEVVTHLLHNMGNVLNSVSVSAGVIEKLLRGTGVYEVMKRIQSIFPASAAEQRTFFAESSRARRLPETYSQIADLLDQHQQDLFDEVANLQVQSAHMKELVLSVSEIQKPIFELFDINILIEDAVKMQSHTLRKYHIEVEHDLMPLAPVRAKKSQILQILVNLIKNACEAMLENEPNRQRLISILSYPQEGYVMVEVNDSGPGIGAEHMGHLFEHGFTTKETGHGFGLHFCRKVMREMNGDLTALSRGPIQGASFKLWIRSE